VTTLLEVVGNVCFGLLAIAGALCAWRAIRRSTLPDRTMGIDVASAVIINALGVGVAVTADDLAIDLLLIAGLLGFLTVITVARYVERRGI
jgi:multisubunit Na+/H+ antiporter MnhF subunit